MNSDMAFVVAMLRLGIEDYLQRKKIHPLDHQSAVKWVTERSPRRWSFDWCCHVIGTDPEIVRREIELRRGEIIERLWAYDGWRISGAPEMAEAG